MKCIASALLLGSTAFAAAQSGPHSPGKGAVADRVPGVPNVSAICDGKSHTLASLGFETVSAAQQRGFPAAEALTDEVDGLVFQAAYDAAPGSVAIQVPPGDCRFSRGLVAGSKSLTITGAGRDQSLLTFLSGGIVFGSGAAPTTGTLAVRHVSLIGAGAAAISAQWSAPGNVYSWLMDDVYIRGGWAHGVAGVNMPRGLSFRDVVAFGTDEVVQPGSAFLFSATRGSFDYTFDNCLAANYAFGFEFDEPGTGLSGIEGVTLRSPRAFNGYGLVKIASANTSYWPPQFRIEDADWQGYGPAILAQHVSGLDIAGGIYILSPLPRGVPPVRSPSGEISVIDLQSVVDSSVRGTTLADLPGDTGFSLLRVDGESASVDISENQLRNFGGVPTAGVRIEANPNPNTVKEHGNLARVWGRVPKVLDVGGTQVSDMLMDEVGATQSVAGIISLPLTTSPLTTDRNGRVSVTFPTRPGGKPLFLQVPTVILTAWKTSAAIGAPTVATVSRTAFTAQVPGAAAGTTLSLSFLAMGR